MTLNAAAKDEIAKTLATYGEAYTRKDLPGIISYFSPECCGYGTGPDEEARDQAGDWPTMDDDHPFSTLWAIHLDNDVGRWCVVGRFACVALRPSRLTLESLGLEPDRDYLVFDFWKEQYLGRVRGGIDCPALELGHCQILAVRPAEDHPQLLSSTRHVSQDAISVKAQEWARGALTLALEGVCGTAEVYWLHVPAGFKLSTLDADGLDATLGPAQPDRAGGHGLAIAVSFPPLEQGCMSGCVIVGFERE